MKYLCPYCREMVDASPEFAGQQLECPHCGSEFILPANPPEFKQAVAPPPKFQYTTIIIRFEPKGLAVRKENLFQGLSEESASQITQLGKEGWELVNIVPICRNKSGFFVTTGQTSGADSAIAFFKHSA